MENTDLFEQIAAMVKPNNKWNRTFTFHEVKILCLDAIEFVLVSQLKGAPLDMSEFFKLHDLD